MEPHKFRYFIVDDHPIMRDGLKISIKNSSERFEYCGEAGDFSTAISSILASDIDLVILDHGLRSKTGLDLIHEIREQRPAIKYLLITQCEEAETLEQYQALKIEGLLSKLNSTTEIKSALQHISEGKNFMCPAIRDILANPRPQQALTARELEVVKLMVEGKSNKEIAVRLQCSDQTVKTHKANLMRKLHLSNTVEVSVWAIKNRLV